MVQGKGRLDLGANLLLSRRKCWFDIAWKILRIIGNGDMIMEIM
ncbi:MAG: hypothetical protein V3U58_04260 [Thermodesulfobacteriota bacterium]